MKGVIIILGAAIVSLMPFVGAGAWVVPDISGAGSKQISLTDARSRIEDCISTPSVMTDVMSKLSGDDQKLFLAEVNKEISDLPASAEEKCAKFLVVDHAALTGGEASVLAELVGIVFATVPLEMLTIVNERFAIDLFLRPDGMTDAQYETIAVNLFEVVVEGCKDADNSVPRCTFALLMLVRASGGTPITLTSTLVSLLSIPVANEIAVTEWIYSALGLGGRQQSYEPLLTSADAGKCPDNDYVLVLAGPQFSDSILLTIFSQNNTTDVTEEIAENIHNPIDPGTGGSLDPTTEPVAAGPSALVGRWNPYTHSKITKDEVDAWVNRWSLGDNLSLYRTCNYKLSSLTLGHALLNGNENIQLGELSMGEKTKFKVALNGGTVMKQTIKSMIQVCGNLGAATPVWNTALSSSLISNVEFDSDTGEITITPSAGASNLFFRVVIPQDS